MNTRMNLNEEKHEEIEKEEKEVKWKKRGKILLFIIIPLVLFTSLSFFILTYVGNLNVLVKEYPLYSSKITNDFDGLKIVHFTDIHYGSVNIDKIKKTVNVINNINPDLVIFTGDLIKKDYIITEIEKENLINELSKIKAKYGKYANLGDNDTLLTEEILRMSSFELINNENKKVYINKSLINIVSTTLNSSELDINTESYTIFLTHYPDNSDEIVSKYNPDLILAGHSLNGNIRLPFLGGIIKRNGAKKYIDRYYEIGNTKLFISNGIGNDKTNFRLLNHPSINFYRLRKSQ